MSYKGYTDLKNTKENRATIALLLREFATAVENETADIIEYHSSGEYFAEVNRFRGTISLTLEPKENDVEFGESIRGFSTNKHDGSAA